MKKTAMMFGLSLIVFILVACKSIAPSPTAIPKSKPTESPAPTSTAIATPKPTNEEDGFIFSEKRSSYRLDLSENGTLVINRETGETITVPYGAKMVFATYSRYSKNTSSIIHNVRSHAETYVAWEEIADLPVDFLRTGTYDIWNGMSPQESIESIDTCPFFFQISLTRLLLPMSTLWSTQVLAIGILRLILPGTGIMII